MLLKLQSSFKSSNLMKIVSTIARVLLGLLFTVFGLNGFFQFIHMPPPSGVAGQYLGILFSTHFYVVIFAAQLAGGVLVLLNRFVALGLVLLGPVLVNILCFHSFMAPDGLGLAGFAAVLWLIVFWASRSAFAGIFQANIETK